MKKGTAILFGFTMLLLGIVTGFLLAPVKHGLYIGNNNNNVGEGESCPPADLDDADDGCETCGEDENMPF